MRIRDWSSDVCSSDLLTSGFGQCIGLQRQILIGRRDARVADQHLSRNSIPISEFRDLYFGNRFWESETCYLDAWAVRCRPSRWRRSEEHTSELQSLMRISYAVFCLKKKTNNHE